MTREIRISIADDEVFERMKRRKQVLDLSWEEVVHRGLRVNEAKHSTTDSARSNFQSQRPDPIQNPDQFTNELRTHIQRQVKNSIANSIGYTSATHTESDSLDSSLDTLEAAEDALMYFDCLDESADMPAFQVPLRVILEAGPDGLSIDVVTIRSGKSTSDMNVFDATARRQIVEHLATGGTAKLLLGTEDEVYEVSPILTWERVRDRPQVASVSIETVHFANE